MSTTATTTKLEQKDQQESSSPSNLLLSSGTPSTVVTRPDIRRVFTYEKDTNLLRSVILKVERESLRFREKVLEGTFVQCTLDPTR